MEDIWVAIDLCFKTLKSTMTFKFPGMLGCLCSPSNLMLSYGELSRENRGSINNVLICPCTSTVQKNVREHTNVHTHGHYNAWPQMEQRLPWKRWEGTLVICVEHIIIVAETEKHRKPGRGDVSWQLLDSLPLSLSVSLSLSSLCHTCTHTPTPTHRHTHACFSHAFR